MSRRGGNYHNRQYSDPRHVDVYTDGACTNNGRDGSSAGIGVYFGPNDRRNVSESVGGRQTNSSAEIRAAERGIRQARDSGYDHVTVHTDSKFLVDSTTKWMGGWQRNDWQKASGGEVVNRTDFEALNNASRGMNVEYKHVSGHSGNAGNDAADQLARQGASRRRY